MSMLWSGDHASSDERLMIDDRGRAMCDHPGCTKTACYGEGFPLRVTPLHWCREHVPHGFLPKDRGDKGDGNRS